MDEDLKQTYALVYDFLRTRTHNKAADALKRVAPDSFDITAPPVGPSLVELVKKARSTTSKQSDVKSSPPDSSSEEESSDSESESDSDSKSEDSTSSSDSDDSKAKTKKTAAKDKAIERDTSVTLSSSSGPEKRAKLVEAAETQKTQKKPASIQSSSSSSSSDSEESEDEPPSKMKKPAKEKSASPKKLSKKATAEPSSSSDSSSSEDSSSDNDSDDNKDEAKSSSDSDSSSSSSSASLKAKRTNKKAKIAETAKTKKASKTKSSSSSSASDSDSSSSDSSEEDEKPPTKKRRTEDGSVSATPSVPASTPSSEPAALTGESKKRTLNEAAAGDWQSKNLGNANAGTNNNNGKPKKIQGPRFSRIRSEHMDQSKWINNGYDAKGGTAGDYGERASRDLIVTRGQGFRKEKNKKKRGSYRGGEITLENHSIRFDD